MEALRRRDIKTAHSVRANWPNRETNAMGPSHQDWVFATATVRIQTPHDDVFAFICDPQNDPQWNPKVLEVTKLTAGPIGFGTTFRYVLAYFAGSIECEWQITNYERGHYLQGKSVRGPIAFEGGYEFELQKGATCVTKYVSFDIADVLPPFIPTALAEKLLSKEFEMAFLRLKRLFDSESQCCG